LLLAPFHHADPRPESDHPAHRKTFTARLDTTHHRGVGRTAQNERTASRKVAPSHDIAANFVHSASAHAARVALRLDETRMTYREFDAAGTRVTGLLHDRGIRPGNQVGVMLPNVME
jgi:non-ribosomal peptide synthetase component F